MNIYVTRSSNIGSITSRDTSNIGSTRSSLKVSEFRNYQRSLFNAKNFHARLVPFFLYRSGDPSGTRY